MRNVLEMLESKGIEAKRVSSNKGGEYHSACPGCGGKDRFIVWPEQNNGTGAYFCRQPGAGCGKGGDNIQFLRDFDGLSFKEAAKAVGREVKDYRTRTYRGPVLKQKQKPAVAAPVYERPAALWTEKANKFVAWAYQNLIDSESQRRYLLRRGIKLKTIKRFMLGFNPGENGRDIFRHRETWGLETVIKKGTNKKLRLAIPIGLVIPLIKKDCLRIRIRRHKAPKNFSKYYVLPGSSMALFGTGLDNRCIVVVESELDAILLSQEAPEAAGYLALGSSHAKPDKDSLYYLKKAALILIALDHDQAGEKALEYWLNNFHQAKHWPTADGKDPGEMFIEGNYNLREWIESGYPPAWTVEANQVGLRPQKTEDKPAPVQIPANVPEKVKELAELLKYSGTKIFKTPKRLAVRTPRKWSAANWERSRYISHLVYFTPEVFDYIENHPAHAIDAKNIFYERR